MPARGTPTRVLVTGGAGFVGSHVVEALLERDIAVHVVDDLSTGARENLAAALREPRCTLEVASIADEQVARRVVGDADAVFHLAGVVGVRRLAEEPLSVMEANLQPTQVLLRAAAVARTPVLFTSSSEVYGDGPVPFDERASVRPGATEGLRGGYACAKAMGEWLAMAHAEAAGVPVLVARLFNTVGPRQRGEHGMVLPRFVQQALAGEPLTVYGEGAQTRCFAHVRDVARALCDLAIAERVPGRVVNVGSNIETSVQELAELVRAAAGSASRIENVPYDDVFPPGFVDPPRRVPCLVRLEQANGWLPTAPIAAIVDELCSAACADQVATGADRCARSAS